MEEFKIWFISDTHAMHGYLKIPEVDMVIHAGDATNYREAVYNHNEMLNFIEWFKTLDIKYKVYIAGNHDISMSNRQVTPGDLKALGITYLEHASTNIEGLNIFGSPFTPAFGEGWVFNKKREKLHDYWQEIPENSDIVITHGPPYSILDLSEDIERNLEHCGCKALMKRLDILKPLVNCFGHIHDNREHRNSGVYINKDTTFINAACVTDGKFNMGVSSNGVIVTIDLETKKILNIDVL